MKHHSIAISQTLTIDKNGDRNYDTSTVATSRIWIIMSLDSKGRLENTLLGPYNSIFQFSDIHQVFSELAVLFATVIRQWYIPILVKCSFAPPLPCR